jgi:hypothetical protein
LILYSALAALDSARTVAANNKPTRPMPHRTLCINLPIYVGFRIKTGNAP